MHSQITLLPRTNYRRVILCFGVFLLISFIAGARSWYAAAKPTAEVLSTSTISTSAPMTGTNVSKMGDLTRQSDGDAPLPVDSTTQTPATRLPARVIHLRARGFEPAEAHWPKGAFFLVVDNRSGVDELTLRVDREAGGRLKEVKVNPRRHRWSGILDPPPGIYLVTEVNHPAWRCRIVITPR